MSPRIMLPDSFLNGCFKCKVKNMAVTMAVWSGVGFG